MIDPNLTPKKNALEAALATEAALPVNMDAAWLSAKLARRGRCAAVIFYGSGLWGSAGDDTLYDFYVLVEHMANWTPHRLSALAGRWLPPNVYYLEEKFDDRTLRAKVAVMLRSEFVSAARGQHFTPQIWARFCQPVRLLQVNNESVRAELVGALADAVVTFHRRTLPLISSVSIQDFWITGLSSTYRSEIRSEPPERAAQRVASELDTFVNRTRLALPLCATEAYLTEDDRVISNLSPRARLRFRRQLTLRRPLLKAVNFARLIKAAFTFQGGLDYARWKVERHSGVSVPLTDFQRRHPVLTGIVLFWRVRRRGGLR